MNLFSMFQYTFLLRAFIVGLLITLAASLLGVSLVLRRNAMISDGLSHVSFGAFAIATVANIAPIQFAIPVAIVASVLILKLNENNKLHGDGAIALLSSSALAIGIMVISVTKGINTDVNNYLFGSILSLSTNDVIVSVVLSLVVLLLFIFSYNKIFALTFDQSFAKSTGTNVEFYNIILAILCSITIVLGMRMMGALLISALTIFPTLTTMQVYKSFKQVVIASSIVGMVCFVIGLSISYLYATPSGASIVIVNLVAFILFKLIALFKQAKG
ncbi:metal ABC transporter permease [Sharpea azabuensis]|uniref:metal ABC transporter permease n=1 Tax=Sharpea azabuensis TaxID=322505 RepID=UPI00156BB8EA|nr:metal ABC transporter permease [Sharpea azabuensis]